MDEMEEQRKKLGLSRDQIAGANEWVRVTDEALYDAEPAWLKELGAGPMTEREKRLYTHIRELRRAYVQLDHHWSLGASW